MSLAVSIAPPPDFDQWTALYTPARANLAISSRNPDEFKAETAPAPDDCRS
jgi:hypothetical protein